MSHVFERELKGILSGDRKWIEGVSRNLPVDVMRSYLKMTEKPFIVLRAAGSFGVDLVAIRGDVSFPIEVKSSVNDTIHFSANSGRGTQQADELLDACKRAHLVPLYAFRMKRVRGDDPWRVFTVKVGTAEDPNNALSDGPNMIPLDEIEGVLNRFYKIHHIPVESL